MESEKRNNEDVINSNSVDNSNTKSYDETQQNLVTKDSQNSTQAKTIPETNVSIASPFIPTPARVLSSMYTTRLGIILSNVAVICVLFCLSSIVSVVISWLFLALGMVLILATLGIVLLVIPGYWNSLMASGNIVANVTNFLMQAWPYISITGIACSVASIVLLALDRNQRHIGRIVFSSIVIGLIVIIMIILAVEGSRA